AHYDPAALAQDSWGLYVRIVASANIFLYDLARIPTWAGLILVAGGAVATLGEHRVTAKAPA
ncbi:MAG TPA: hypothetical protein VKG44_05495, partial [Candidatus Baltobacteraceae bacterium]|nr:hypothetical protein [Candidatus Baltobacteraceae bacterium]